MALGPKVALVPFPSSSSDVAPSPEVAFVPAVAPDLLVWPL
jgi:hypothetical protein